MSGTGDIIETWDKFLELNLLSGDGTSNNRTAVFVNSLLAVALWFQAFRLGFTSLLNDKGIEHLYGHHAMAVGRFWKLYGLLMGYRCAHAAGYRVIFAYLQYKNRVMILQSNKGLCSLGRQKLVGTLLKMIRGNAIMHALQGIAGFVLLWLLNVGNSKTTEQVVWWSIWTLFDLIFAPIAIVTFDVLNMITAVILFHQSVECQKFINSLKGEPDIRKVIKNFSDLRLKSETVNKFTSPIITYLVWWAAPGACIPIFIVVQTENRLLQPVLFLLTVSYIANNTIVLYFYAKLNEKPAQIHESMASLLNRVRSTRDKMYLLSMMQDVESKSSLLGMYTCDGNRYNVLSFATYLMDIATQYLLVLSFKNVFEMR